ncbi:MAG: Tad domain-containing protein [Deltaproteobacteria bacterium]|nr:Tad domain-containing protein [Deltaproteobacteria bacterium]
MQKIKLNQQGQIVIFFVLLIPLIVLMLVTTVTFSKAVFTKMKLQGALDRGVYAGGSYLTEVLNQIALLNWDAHEKFLVLKNDFRGVSQPAEKKAKERIEKLWIEQNQLYDQMEMMSVSAHKTALEIASEEVRKEFPNAELHSLYTTPIILKDGPRVDFSFDKIRGQTIFDPTDHQKISKTGFEARMAFVKDPSKRVAFVAEAKTAEGLHAMAGAQPFAGSLFNFAKSPDKNQNFLYRTAMVPVETLLFNAIQH